jgi:hypothetical protein
MQPFFADRLCEASRRAERVPVGAEYRSASPLPAPLDLQDDLPLAVTALDPPVRHVRTLQFDDLVDHSA